MCNSNITIIQMRGHQYYSLHVNNRYITQIYVEQLSINIITFEILQYFTCTKTQ
jgi:hypothetical protein